MEIVKSKENLEHLNRNIKDDFYKVPNLNFDINLITDYNEKLNLSIYDINGRVIISDNLYKTTNSTYTYDLNMASYEAGVYLVRLGNSEIGFKTERIIVR